MNRDSCNILDYNASIARPHCNVNSYINKGNFLHVIPTQKRLYKADNTVPSVQSGHRGRPAQ